MAHPPFARHATPTVEHLDVIRVTFQRGSGDDMSRVLRNVEAYYLPDGQLLVEQDSCAEPRPETDSWPDTAIIDAIRERGFVAHIIWTKGRLSLTKVGPRRWRMWEVPAEQVAEEFEHDTRSGWNRLITRLFEAEHG